MLRVLLLSPLQGHDPACGDLVYTDSLLADPPDGVQYETYVDALARGALREHGNRSAFKLAVQNRRRVVAEGSLTAIAHLINRMRRARWLFWEPFRFFSVAVGEYDVIHLHVFSARFLNLPCPLIVSNAAPLRFLYTKARGYSERRAAILEHVEMALGSALGVNVVSYDLPQATRLVAFTEFLKCWYVNRGIMPTEQIDVVPIFIPSAKPAQGRTSPRRIGFIAKDFDAKGGQILLTAFEQVRRVRPDTELCIVGCPPRIKSEEAAQRGITWIPFIDRHELLAAILPTFDVFGYPTQFDGLPLVVLEAMAHGIPIATSDYQAMPAILGNGLAGLVSPVGDARALAANLSHLLAPAVNRRYRASAREHFESTYSAQAVRPRLLKCYQAAIEEWKSSKPVGRVLQCSEA